MLELSNDLETWTWQKKNQLCLEIYNQEDYSRKTLNIHTAI